MRYMVTGGLGFIGYHLCKSLLSDGNDVVCVDNLITGSKNNLFNDERFTFYEADIENLPFSATVGYYDGIFNLASPTSPSHCKKNPIETLSSNIRGTEKVLKFASLYNIPLVHLSSIRVLEKNDTFTDIACYIEGKRVAETLCYEYHKMNNKIKVLRLFSAYGPNMNKDDSRVIPQFIQKALNNEDIIIQGDGTQIDSFMYIDDLIHNILYFIDVDLERPINIGSNAYASINGLTNTILRLTDSKSNVIHKGTYNGNTDRSKMEATSMLKKQTSLEDGLRKTIRYYLEGENAK